MASPLTSRGPRHDLTFGSGRSRRGARVKLLVRTLAPLQVVDAGVDVELEPRQICLLRCDAGRWTALGQPEPTAGRDAGARS
ncbi:MAG: hypothetical protein JNL82_24965 [Myxococcales bacterium]|nr:hypothetical protein [Myxococcales bacterium]